MYCLTWLMGNFSLWQILDAGCSMLDTGSWMLDRRTLRETEEAATRIGTGISYPRSSIQNPASSIQYPASSIDHRASSIQHPASSLQHPASSIQPPASSLQHPASSLQQKRPISTIPPYLCGFPKPRSNCADCP